MEIHQGPIRFFDLIDDAYRTVPFPTPDRRPDDRIQVDSF